jgi:tetratricopeptide (TPR) repeat protein/regulation of enolase protein 1 (concanavalin A-like superfamily)
VRRTRPRRQGKWTLAICLATAAVPRAARSDQWVEARSPHAVVISDAGASVARRVAQRFERFRGAIKVLWPWARVDPAIPPVILVPRDEGGLKTLLPEYWQEKNAARPGGVFVDGEVHPWIVLRADLTDPEPGRPNPYHVIHHEYVHLVIRRNFERVPAWLNEGLAELLGGITVRGDGIVIGQPLEHHVQLLRDRPLLPVEKLFQIDHRSPEYAERDRVNLFYAESWALTHYLVLDPRASADLRLKGFVGKVVAGMDPLAALRTQGLDPAEIDRSLEAYARQVAYRGATRSARVELPGDIPVRDLPEVDWLMAGAAFLADRGRTAEATAILERAERRQPDLAAIQKVRGIVLSRDGRPDEARERLERAVRLDPSDPTVRILAARVAPATPEGQALARAHLETALERAPEHAGAHQLLAEALLAQGQTASALERALRAAQLEPGSGKNRLTLARSLAASGRTREAREEAEKAAALGLEGADDAAGFALLESLASAPDAPVPPASISVAPSPSPGASPATSSVAPVGQPAAWGVFVDADGGSRLVERGPHVEIGVPAGAFDLSAEIGKVNAPRLLRPVVGDFVAQVTVSRAPRPDGRQALPGRAPFSGAGLLLWQDDRNYVRLEVGAFVNGRGSTIRFALFEQRRAGVLPAGLSNAGTRLADAPTQLRLERRGRSLVGLARQGSDEWREVGRFELELPPTVYVGVAAVNASQAAFTAEFDELQVRSVP